MCGSGDTPRSNARLLAASVAATLLIYAARWAAAGEHDQHLRWRCPVPLTAALFAGGQLSGVIALALEFKEGSVSLRRPPEPPAKAPLTVFLVVSVTSTVMPYSGRARE